MSTTRVPPALPAEQVRQGATIKAFREMRGLTLDELARRVDISRPYLSNLEAGRKRLTPVLVARVADALAVPQIAIVRPDEAEVAA